MITVALIGPDGAGKSSIAQRLEREPMPAPVKRIYMGVNLEASSLMLPTTRLALAVKTARGRRADMVAPGNVAVSAGSPMRRAVTGGARVIRLLMWLAEEWFRMAVAEFHRRRGAIVVFDRHFFADYYRAGTAGGGRLPLTGRLHAALLRHAYPRPGLMICLDAPGAVLYERKREASADWLEQRRAQYLQLSEVVPDFVVVDVDRPIDVVTREVASVITDYFEKRRV
jgi:thymidylate kinase